MGKLSPTRELENLQKEYADFLYMFSHDLRAPLRHIREFITIFIEDMPEDFSFTDSQKKALEIIQHSSCLTEDMMKGVLMLSRLNTKAKEHVELDLKELFFHASSLVFSKGALKGQGFILEFPKKWPSIKGDDDQMILMFKHVLDNAKKFQKNSEKKRVSVTISESPLHWHCDIVDNGIGVEPDQAIRAFKAFTQLNPPHEYEGVGIGLALTQKIMNAHNGLAAFISQENGACLRLSFIKEYPDI